MVIRDSRFAILVHVHLTSLHVTPGGERASYNRIGGRHLPDGSDPERRSMGIAARPEEPQNTLSKGNRRMREGIRIAEGALWTGALVLLTTGAVTAQGAPPKPVGTTKVAYRLISLDQYAGFVSAWNDTKRPVKLVLARNSADLTSVFQPAPVMGGRRPYAPDASLFANSDLLIVARVARDSRAARCFRLGSVTRSGNVITVAYRFVDPAPSAGSAQFKVAMAIAVPKDAAFEYRFVENGKQVGSLPELPEEQAPDLGPRPG